ncbi:CRISPR-associated endonuclease Cas2 [Sphingomonas sp. VNH70]|uniref:CRISPR-associated endonuclease Cas2 n=1 Tax=Sphingomonas silueang TaxID=3156617 RepID=UPI0032B449B5
MSDPSFLSGYRLMWIFVMFDLPVGTRKQMRDATRFRQFLLDEGFEMSQFSVYARFCSGRDSFNAHLARIERNLPEKGEVHILTFTDRQYENIVRFSSQRRKRPRKNPDQLALF